jgi:21S rRNA (GM2251-2'-O)-methyltransferase
MKIVVLLIAQSSIMIRSAVSWSTTITTASHRRLTNYLLVGGVGSTKNNNRLPIMMSSMSTDDEGRTIRSKSDRSSPNSDNGWDNFDAWESSPPPSQQPNKPQGTGGGGRPQKRGNWDDVDPRYTPDSSKSTYAPRGGSTNRRPGGGDSRSNRSNRSGGETRGGESRWKNDRNTFGYANSNRAPRNGDGDNDDGRRTFRGGAPPTKTSKEPDELKINMRALEGAGFVHLYGLASCVNALQANRRDFTRPEDLINIDELEGDALDFEMKQRARKPEAQYTPWLFVQDQSTSKRTTDKAKAADLIIELAKERGIPMATVDKGVLNALSGNRPHQGYVLRCGKLDFEPISSLPLSVKKLWLCLDEVVDPQNLGALLRSAYFLNHDDIGIVVCAKNSAPPSPIVSAASAGALELAHVFATSNLPKLLTQAQQDGFRVVGASSSVPYLGGEAQVYSLDQLPSSIEPTVLVLGSEGHGLRTLVAKACTDFVCIPGGSGDGVDSLNVSVTGGILLWHLLNNKSPSSTQDTDQV